PGPAAAPWSAPGGSGRRASRPGSAQRPPWRAGHGAGRRWRSLDESSLSGESSPAVEDAPLAAVEPAPDADAFVVVERPGEAVPADRAAGADGLGGRAGPGVADVGEEEVGEAPAGGVPGPRSEEHTSE